jgi:hypothetical protein
MGCLWRICKVMLGEHAQIEDLIVEDEPHSTRSKGAQV